MVKKETVEELADRIKGNEPAQETGGSVNIEELADKIMADGGNNAQSFEASTRNVISNIDPFSTSGFEQEYTPEQHEFDQGLFADATSGLYNSLVIDLGEGITNLIPTIAQAAGDEGEWASKWKNNTTSWFDAQRTIYSDKANAPIEGFSDITSAHVAQGIGQGIGFILGIAGGSGWAGAASKGGKALNTINVLTKAGKTAEAAAVLSKTGKTIKALDKSQSTAARIGSYMTGTTLMYPMIDEEAKKAGLSDVDASRFALGVSGLVSLTEGAALEWIGTIASKPITGGITKSVVQKVLKQAKNKSPLELQKLFLKEFNQSVKGNVSKVVKSASTEMGQEFSQTYIEEGSKKLYDTIYSKGKKIGDDHFGADLDFRTKKGYETFVQATFGGLIGGLIGGGMGGFHMSKGGSDIAQETMFGYINSSVKTGNFKNINKLKEASDVMLKEEKITEEDNVLIKERIDSLAEFATDTNTSGVNDGVALYQMYQLDNTRKDINKSAEGVVLSEEANPTLQKQAKQKRGKIEQVAERVQEQFDSVFDSGKPDTKNKTKFEDRLGDYKDIVQDIDENNIEQEVIDKRLDKIFDPKAKEKSQEKAQAKVAEAEMDKPKEAVDFGKSYTNADGVTLTEASLTQEAKADITAIHSKAMEAREDKEKQSEIIQEAADKYGIDKDGITAIALGRVSDLNEVSVKEEAPKEDKVAEPKKVTPEATVQTTESLIAQVETQENLTEKDLDKFQEEADKKEISSPELVDAISKRREEIVAKKEAKSTAKKTEEKPTTKSAEVEEVTKEEVVSEKPDEKTEEITNIKTAKNEFYKKPNDPDWYRNSFGTETKATPILVAAALAEVYPETYNELKEYKEVIASIGKPVVQEGKVTPEEQEKIDEQVAENVSAEQTKIDRIKSINRRKKLVSKEQRKRINSYDAQLIRDNPALYSEVKKHFKRIFPSIPMREVDGLGTKYGVNVLARLIESGIEIDPNKAIQTSLIHEYGHVFLETLGANHPLVKLGHKIIKDTDFFKEAKENYPDKLEAEQLNEALTEAVAVDSLSILERRLDGAKFEQFKEWLKSLWSKLKSTIGKANQKDVTRLLARNMTLANKPFSTDISTLIGMDKNQRKSAPIPRRVANTVDSVYESLSIQLLEYISDKDATFDFKNKRDQSLVAFSTLLEQYYDEKNNLVPSDAKIFDNVDLGIPIKEDWETLEDVRGFAKALKEKDSEIFSAADTVVNSMFKSNLEVDLEEDIDDEVDQGDEIDNQGSDNAIKATKRVSLSVRSILSSIVDNAGKKVGSDAVFSYVANIAENTYKKAGLVKALENDQQNPIARRITQLISSLRKGSAEDKQKLAGFLQEISSLVQVESEGANFSITKTDKGTSYAVRNPIRNKDKTYNGLTEVLSNLTKEEQDWLKLSNLKDQGYIQAVGNFYNKGEVSEDLSTFIGELGNILNVTITEDSLRKIIDNFTPSYNKDGSLKYSKIQNLFFALGSTNEKSASLVGVSLENTTFDKITGFLDKIFSGIGLTVLNNTYLNGANNTVTTTQLGHWVSTLNSMLTNDESGRVEAMQKSDIYKNNPVFDYFVKEGKVRYSVFDSLKNFATGENVEYADMSDRDYMMLQLSKFGTSTSKNHYSQTLGVKSNRQSITMFEVPSYTGIDGKFDRSQLRRAYDNQVAMLQPILTKMLSEAKNDAAKKDLIEDFNKLYIHTANKDGNITSGLSKAKYESEINEIKTIAKANNLDKAFSNKIGRNKQGGPNQFESFNDLVENFFFVEALNRTSLNDIYGGVALEYANIVAGKATKGGVQQNTKRMSSSDSNGKQIEIDKPIHYIVYETNDSGADSFKFNGSHLTKHIDKETGSLDPLGINSKELVFQVDPKTGQTVYIKTSGLNLKVNEDGSTNLDGFGDNMKALANAMKSVEQMLATEADPNPYVVFMDSSASKGTHKFKTVNFQDVMDGDLTSVKSKVNTITIDNLTTPFNLNKTLKGVNEQEAILSTQAAIIQFNANQDINAFEEAATEYLEEKMKGKNGKPGIVDQLLDFDANINELTKDMNEREKSATTEILDAIKEYNANPDNKKKITTFDHPSLKLVYEQFVASRLAKRGTKVEMPGNFMHQLPDFSGKGKKLEGKQVAVSWKMFFDEKPTKEQEDAFIASADNKVAVVRIPSSAEMSIFGGTVGYFLDTDANVVVLSDEFVDYSDSDHDGDKAMVYRREIGTDGKFISEEESIKTKMFNRFYDNLTTAEFEKKRETTLSLDPIREAVGVMEGDFATATINEMVDVAQKMGLGQVATGRFAIAGKLMALLSQSNEELKKAITYKGKPLKEFTNESLDDIARLLQAALDIGNDPILSETGFTETTINVGNAMLLLGVDTKGVIEFLKFPAISDLNEGYNNANLAMSDNAKISFDSYFNEIATTFDKSDGKNREKTLEELAKTRVNGKLLGKVGAAAVSKYGEFKLVGDDLSKMIGYIKLDKGLPKNADANRKLMDDISSFKDLAFTTSRLTDRKLNQHRVGVAKDEGKIFRKQLLTSNKTVLDLIDKTSKLTSNAFQFKKKAAESVMKIIAQKQIKNAPKNVGEFIYSFAEKIKSLKTFNSTGEYDITVDTDARTNSNVKNMYNISKASPLMTNREAVTAYSGSTDAAVLDKYEPLLAKYEEAVNDVSEMDKFADNKFIEYTQVVEQEDGTSLLRLDPKFKVTTQVTQDVKDGFLEIQKNDPALAQEIVNYQLYRHGVNNKIGSFIDVLPKSIDIKQLTDVSEFKESIEDMPSVDAIYAVDEALMDNLIADNKSLLGDVHTSEINSKSIIGEQEFPTSFETDEELGTYVTYNGNIYKKFGSGYTKLGNIQGDENFTAFEQAPISSVEKVVEVKQFPNEYLLTNGTILSLPNNDVSIDLGPKGSYTILPSGEINNDKSGNKVKENTPIYFSIIEQYQEQQANDLNNNCK